MKERLCVVTVNASEKGTETSLCWLRRGHFGRSTSPRICVYLFECVCMRVCMGMYGCVCIQSQVLRSYYRGFNVFVSSSSSSSSSVVLVLVFYQLLRAYYCSVWVKPFPQSYLVHYSWLCIIYTVSIALLLIRRWMLKNVKLSALSSQAHKCLSQYSRPNLIPRCLLLSARPTFLNLPYAITGYADYRLG